MVFKEDILLEKIRFKYQNTDNHVLKDVSLKIKKGSKIGFIGKTGSGKSSLMHMCFDALSKDKDTLCIKFNGWLFEGYEDAKTALIAELASMILDVNSD